MALFVQMRYISSFRHEKDTCFIDAANEKYTEELPELWWHGLTRSMYEHIFAVGLED